MGEIGTNSWFLGEERQTMVLGRCPCLNLGFHLIHNPIALAKEDVPNNVVCALGGSKFGSGRLGLGVTVEHPLLHRAVTSEATSWEIHTCLNCGVTCLALDTSGQNDVIVSTEDTMFQQSALEKAKTDPNYSIAFRIIVQPKHSKRKSVSDAGMGSSEVASAWLSSLQSQLEDTVGQAKLDMEERLRQFREQEELKVKELEQTTRREKNMLFSAYVAVQQSGGGDNRATSTASQSGPESGTTPTPFGLPTSPEHDGNGGATATAVTHIEQNNTSLPSADTTNTKRIPALVQPQKTILAESSPPLMPRPNPADSVTPIDQHSQNDAKHPQQNHGNDKGGEGKVNVEPSSPPANTPPSALYHSSPSSTSRSCPSSPLRKVHRCGEGEDDSVTNVATDTKMDGSPMRKLSATQSLMNKVKTMFTPPPLAFLGNEADGGQPFMAPLSVADPSPEVAHESPTPTTPGPEHQIHRKCELSSFPPVVLFDFEEDSLRNEADIDESGEDEGREISDISESEEEGDNTAPSQSSMPHSSDRHLESLLATSMPIEIHRPPNMGKYMGAHGSSDDENEGFIAPHTLVTVGEAFPVPDKTSLFTFKEG